MPAYFHSQRPSALNAPGGVLRWQLFQTEDGSSVVGFLESKSEPQIKFLRSCAARGIGGGITELTEDAYREQLGKSKGRPAKPREREHISPTGIRGGEAPVTGGDQSAPVAVADLNLPTDPTPVLKRRDVR
jgi:hypothetical protein